MKYLYNTKVIEAFNLMTSAKVLMAVTLILLMASLLAGCQGDPNPPTAGDTATAPITQ